MRTRRRTIAGQGQGRTPRLVLSNVCTLSCFCCFALPKPEMPIMRIISSSSAIVRRRLRAWWTSRGCAFAAEPGAVSQLALCPPPRTHPPAPCPPCSSAAANHPRRPPTPMARR